MSRRLGSGWGEAELWRCARDTWHSLSALVDEGTGMPSDNINSAGTRAPYTSPTNIGCYLWSAVAAHELGFIPRRELAHRVAHVLDTVGRLTGHEPSGMYFNWYEPDTGAVTRRWPRDGSKVTPFLSSVDNAWLAAGLWLVCQALPSLARPAAALLGSMDFGWYHDPAVGLLRGGFWADRPDQPSVVDAYPSVFYTAHHYSVLNSETRIASYVGIALGHLEPQHYFRLWRVPPVHEGRGGRKDTSLVLSWSGGMFEALMVPILIPETRWGKGSWALNHRRYVDAQISYGLSDSGYGYWGLSPCRDPAADYREYGVASIGMRPDDPGSGTEVERAVVTPHASFLALDYRPRETMENLGRLLRDFPLYGPGGCYDSVNVLTGQVSEHYLALDQAMILGSTANVLRPDCLRRHFATGVWRDAIRPLLRRERFRLG